MKTNWLIGILTLSILTGCSLFTPIPDSPQLSLTTGPGLNPDIENRSSPVVLRIYELTDVANFEQKEFFDIYDNDKTSLADTLVRKRELELNPNESRTLTLAVDEKTRYLGLLAAFRQLDDAKWRVIIPLQSRKPTGIPVYENNQIDVRLDNNRIVLNR